ncbi:uncharacterized protein KLLA0_D01001g [Kluyveromyces lactis]|uniref:KLLA0D01001p n=1 Tax=Kluyveromyces lactis (strain ATCC 8585 / CBS 2359 / DSM 70799 / NBRC 1267 / NRRL Y-1140 / WM37) TaxID=284590 RepID=Q6CSH4_KLULA|nr:uncharacterized protein KLLA0_D01001g [Kluyveromyces lactis]CAH00211.1 KLLA0D01001p [Kluyveromyces lactis]|eukprot:XP_453115.1 uncharacterized protein KLLA0_D01001g [Kluyveromyces lactis]
MSEYGNIPYPIKDLDSFTLSEETRPTYDKLNTQQGKVNLQHNSAGQIKSDKTLPKLSNLKDKFKIRNNKYLRSASSPEKEERDKQQNTIVIVTDDEEPEKQTVQQDIYQEYIPSRIHTTGRESSKHRKIKLTNRRSANPQRQSESIGTIVTQSTPIPVSSNIDQPSILNTFSSSLKSVFDYVDTVIDVRFPLLISYRRHVKIMLIVIFILQVNWYIELLIILIARSVYQ